MGVLELNFTIVTILSTVCFLLHQYGGWSCNPQMHSGKSIAVTRVQDKPTRLSLVVYRYGVCRISDPVSPLDTGRLLYSYQNTGAVAALSPLILRSCLKAYPKEQTSQVWFRAAMFSCLQWRGTGTFRVQFIYSIFLRLRWTAAQKGLFLPSQVSTPPTATVGTMVLCPLGAPPYSHLIFPGFLLPSSQPTPTSAPSRVALVQCLPAWDTPQRQQLIQNTLQGLACYPFPQPTLFLLSTENT